MVQEWANICADKNTRACTKMEVTRLLVRTKHSKVLTEDIKAIINECSFNIKILEESQGSFVIQILTASLLETSSDKSDESEDESSKCYEDGKDFVET